MKLPTDRQILEEIYKRYHTIFSSYSSGKDTSRDSKIYVPIDIEELSNDLGVDKDIIFGRLYYHLDHKYSYPTGEGSRVAFFSLAVGKDKHCINFPLAASVLAELTDEHEKYARATWIAVVSLVVSMLSLLFSLTI